MECATIWNLEHPVTWQAKHFGRSNVEAALRDMLQESQVWCSCTLFGNLQVRGKAPSIEFHARSTEVEKTWYENHDPNSKSYDLQAAVFICGDGGNHGSSSSSSGSSRTNNKDTAVAAAAAAGVVVVVVVVVVVDVVSSSGHSD